MKIAVVKPDHLGDFILAIPAIRALQARARELVLFVASANFALARHHFPGLELVALDLPSLNRKLGQDNWRQVYRALGRLREFDFCLFLRNDGFLTRSNARAWTDFGFMIEDRGDRHQTQLEYDVVEPLSGPYDIEALFFQGASPRFPSAPKSVVFAIGAGFPYKKWSPLAWAELALSLQKQGVRVQILSGPSEIAESAVIACAGGLDEERDVFVGSPDFRALEQWLQAHDLVVAVDGGSAHLCSLVKPVVTIFGPSPRRRFCSIGSYNRIVTRDLPCHPCTGFDARALNACMSRECMYGLRASHIVEAMSLRSGLPGTSWRLSSGNLVEFGLSAQAA